jgi:RCC1 and BTB domain-containing protein
MSGIKAVKVACGGFHTAAITETGAVYTWGGGEHGQLGLGDKINKTVPTPITTLDSYQITSITCGWSHTVALSSCGKVFTWGNGDHGKLGHGTTAKVAVPKLVESLAHLRVIKIASYNEHTAALCHAGLGFSHGSGQTVSREYVLNMRGMLNNEEFSDVTFKVEGRFIHAHKNILASRCQHFKNMFSSGMRESRESEILIPTTPYSVFMSLLEFLYTDNIDNLGAEDAILLFSAADLYNLDRLKDMTAVVVRRSISTDNACKLLQVSHDAHAQDIKEICLQYVVTKFEIISKSEAIQTMSHGLLIECLQMRP